MTGNKGNLGFWAVVVLATIMAVFGFPIFAGGIWLITLGGSWYYALAGLGLLISAYFLARRSIYGVWVYLLTFAGTVIWALWEAGFNGWAQVPRLVAPTVILVLVLLTIPALRGRFGMSRSAATTAAIGVIALGGTALALTSVRDGLPLFAQEAPAATQSEPTTVPANPPQPFSALETGADWPAYGGTQHAARYSPLDQITPENVANLEVAWEFRTGDLPEGDEAFGNQNTPIKVGDKLVLCSALNKVTALDAATGTEFGPMIHRFPPTLSVITQPAGGWPITKRRALGKTIFAPPAS